MCAPRSARVGVYGVGAGRTGRASSAPSSSSARSAGGTTSSPTPAAGAAAASTGNKPASGHKLIEVAETIIPSSLPILPPSLPMALVASLGSKPLHSSLQSSLRTSLTTSSSWTESLASSKLASVELAAAVEVGGLTGRVSPPGRTSGTVAVTAQPPGGGEASSLTARARRKPTWSQRRP